MDFKPVFFRERRRFVTIAVHVKHIDGFLRQSGQNRLQSSAVSDVKGSAVSRENRLHFF